MPESTNPSSGNQHSGKPTLSWSQPAATKPVSVPSVPPVMPLQTTAPSIAHHEPNSNTGTYVGIFVAGIIVGALIGWGISAVKNSKALSTATSSTSGVASSTPANGNKKIDFTGATIGSGDFSVSSVQRAGYRVALSNMSVQKPTWFAVYDDFNGEAGSALGAVLIYPVAHEGTIELLRPIVSGHKYLVGRSIDNGDNLYSLTNDKPVTDAHGAPLYTVITAQ